MTTKRMLKNISQLLVYFPIWGARVVVFSGLSLYPKENAPHSWTLSKLARRHNTGVWVGLRAYPGNPSYPASHRRTIHPSHNVFGTSLRRTTSSRQNIFYETSVVSLMRERWPWWWGNNSSSEFGFSLGALRDVQIVFLFFNLKRKSMSIKQDRAFPSKRSHRQNMNSCGQGANPIKSNPHITFYLHSSQCTVFVGQAPEW